MGEKLILPYKYSYIGQIPSGSGPNADLQKSHILVASLELPLCGADPPRRRST